MQKLLKMPLPKCRGSSTTETPEFVARTNERPVEIAIMRENNAAGFSVAVAETVRVDWLWGLMCVVAHPD